MKVLKLKDPSTFKNILTKRGNNIISPAIDAEGNCILGFSILTDPVYADLTEIILDQCEVIDHKPLEFDVLEEKPIEAVKGEFAAILRNARNLEEAVTIYYDTRPGILGRAMNAINKNVVQPIVNFFNE